MSDGFGLILSTRDKIDRLRTISDETAIVSGNPTADAAYFKILDPRTTPLLIAKLSYYCITAAGNVDLGVYWSDGTTIWKVCSSGLIAASGSSAVQTLDAATPAMTPVGVDLYAAFYASNAGLAYGRVNGTTAILTLGKRMLAKTSATSLAASYALSDLTASNVIPWFDAAAT